MKAIDPLREHLSKLLQWEDAHADFASVVKDFPSDLAGKKIPEIPYTAWQLIEHLRIAQGDILEFCRNSKHVSPEWPEGYWPTAESPPGKDSWQRSVNAFRKDLKSMEKLVEDPSTDVFAKIPHGQGQTILREVLLVADHNAYHLGQLMLVRRLLKAGRKNR
jgi:hypothetical protein